MGHSPPQSSYWKGFYQPICTPRLYRILIANPQCLQPYGWAACYEAPIAKKNRRAGEEKKRSQGGTRCVFSGSYILLYLSFLSTAEQRVYIGNTKIFPQLSRSRKSFRRGPYNNGVLVPFVPSIPIHPLVCSLIIPGQICEHSYIVYKPGILIPLWFIAIDKGNY